MKLFEIGKKIRLLRKDCDLTQLELANLANISRVTLGKIERGNMGTVSIKTLDIILDALGYEIEFTNKKSFGIPTLDEISSNEEINNNRNI